MELSELNSQEAIRDLHQIKKVLSETTNRVSKIYLFFYGAAFIYFIHIFLSLAYLFPIQHFRDQTVLINDFYYFSDEVRNYYERLMDFQGLATAIYPLLLLFLFIFIKFKSIPKSNRYAHKLLHIWMYGFMIIYFGTTFIRIRLFNFMVSYLEPLLPMDVETYDLIYGMMNGLNYIGPFIMGVVLLFIYLIMNLITNNKIFLIGVFANLITYMLYLFSLPTNPESFIINDILNMKISTILSYQLINNLPTILLIINLLIIGTYFKKMYRAEQIAYED